MVRHLGLGPGRTVVDLGAGTGKMTRMLAPSAARVVAVEPVAAMRAELQRAVPGVEVHDATAQHLPFARESIDGIVCAQSFHWFATPEVLRELARVLRAGGGLALVWNERDPSAPLNRSFDELLSPYKPERPEHETGRWRSEFVPDGPFGPIKTVTFHHEQPMTPDLLVARASSTSFVGVLAEAERAGLLARVRALGEDIGKSFPMPYRTQVHLTSRPGDGGPP